MFRRIPDHQGGHRDPSLRATSGEKSSKLDEEWIEGGLIHRPAREDKEYALRAPTAVQRTNRAIQFQLAKDYRVVTSKYL